MLIVCISDAERPSRDSAEVKFCAVNDCGRKGQWERRILAGLEAWRCRRGEVVSRESDHVLSMD